MAPVPTSEFRLGMNLDANAVDGARFSATVQFHDSQGTAHLATLSLQKEISADPTPVTRWRFDLTIPEREVAGASPDSKAKFSLLTGAVAADPPAQGALVFDDAGRVISAYVGADPATLPALGNLDVPPSGVTIPALANGAALAPISWKLVDSTSASVITGFASASEMTTIEQDGAAPGSMSSMSVLPDGTLAAVFSNGRTMAVGQIVLAQFTNPDGLTAHGGGLFSESLVSGVSRVGIPGESGLGSLQGGVLEQSNVDLALELTKIITFQRGYQANARMITTTDQVLQETLNLLR
jgi:flagellar hook protein FlgE